MLGCISSHASTYALSQDGDKSIAWVEKKPVSHLWINPGFYSYHFERDLDLNDKNPFGLVGKTLLFHSKKIRFKSYSGYLLWNIAKQVKALIFDIDIIGSNPIIPGRSLRMYTRAQLVLKM